MLLPIFLVELLTTIDNADECTNPELVFDWIGKPMQKSLYSFQNKYFFREYSPKL